MKNRDIYWRRYKIQGTLYIRQWHLSLLWSSHLGTSHSSPSHHQLLCGIFLKSSFTYVHSSPLSLAARLHWCHANHSCYIYNVWTFSGQTLYVWCCIVLNKNYMYFLFRSAFFFLINFAHSYVHHFFGYNCRCGFTSTLFSNWCLFR